MNTGLGSAWASKLPAASHSSVPNTYYLLLLSQFIPVLLRGHMSTSPSQPFISGLRRVQR